MKEDKVKELVTSQALKRCFNWFSVRDLMTTDNGFFHRQGCWYAVTEPLGTTPNILLTRGVSSLSSAHINLAEDHV